MTLRVGVFGAVGRMGTAVCRAVADDPELRLVAAADPHHADIDLRQATGVDAEIPVVAGADSIDPSTVDVMVDFTQLGPARENLAWCAANGIHAVSGTTGFTDADYDRLRSSFTASNCVVAPNFAIGAVLMMRFAELAAPWFETAEIIELHHDAKIDAPSGTAMLTAQRMADASQEWGEDPTKTETLPGARGAKGPADIPVHSVRLKGLVAHQEVLLGTTGQSLVIRHDSYDRTSFMPGVLVAVRQVPDRAGLTVGLDSLLDL